MSKPNIASGPESDQAREVIRVLAAPTAVPAHLKDPGPQANDYVKYGYSPRGSDLRDFSIICYQDVYHVFYIDLRYDLYSRQSGQVTMLGHSSSPDLVEWERHDPPLFIDVGHWDGSKIAAPYVFLHDGVFYMFYMGAITTLAQAIGFATSKDLFEWKRYEGNPVLHPGFFPWAKWSSAELSDCRDPHLLQREDDFVLYYTALCRDGQVCVAAATSKNLVDWSDAGPVYHFLPDPKVSPLCLESACVHRVADSSYALFFCHDNGTQVVISDNELDFRHSSFETLWPGHWALELVEARANKWLVACFRKNTGPVWPARLFFGVLDWSRTPLAVQPVENKMQMKEQLAFFRHGN